MSSMSDSFAPLGPRAGRGPWFSADEVRSIIDRIASGAYVDDDAGYDIPEANFNSGIGHLSDELDAFFAAKEAGR